MEDTSDIEMNDNCNINYHQEKEKEAEMEIESDKSENYESKKEILFKDDQLIDEFLNNLNTDDMSNSIYDIEQKVFIDNFSPIDKNNTGNNRRITIKEKLNILDEVKAKGRNKTALKYGIAESTLTYWKQQENKLMESNKNIKIILHKGRKPIYPEIEEKLINFIEFNRKLLNPLTSYSIAQQMYKIMPQLKNKKYKAILNWIYRFLQRNHCSLEDLLM
jgi:hypothetical protein